MTLRLGLIGRGRWGRNIERTLLEFADVELVLIPRGRAVELALDGVLIATPSATHAEVALPYIESGIPTFVEKPMATSVADAERIASAARRAGSPVFVGHIMLHHPAFRRALEILPTLGAPRLMFCEGMNNRPRTDSSVLWDWLPHHLAMTHATSGPPASVESWALTGPETKAAVSRFDCGGSTMVSTASWLSPVDRSQVTIVCEAGSIVFDDKAERKLAVFGRDQDVAYPEYPPTPPLRLELEAFISLVREASGSRPDLDLEIAIVKQIAAAEASAAAGGRTVAISR